MASTSRQAGSDVTLAPRGRRFVSSREGLVVHAVVEAEPEATRRRPVVERASSDSRHRFAGWRPGASTVLGLQRRAGNRAATTWVQRASCCAGCRAGGECESDEAHSSPAAAGSPVMQRLAAGKPTLRRGSVGPPVSEAQQLLNQAIGAGIATDGQFGPVTDGAVRAFQADRGLTADGIVGALTWDAFEPATAAPPTPGKETDPANDFRIRGLPDDRAEHPDTIFFDFAESAVPADEEPKIAALAASPGPLVLHGSSSEEGAGNTALTNRRIGSVDTLMAEHGHAAVRTPNNVTAGAVGKIDYRHARAVLVAPVGAPGPDQCAGTSGAETCPSTVGASFDRADALLGQAAAKLASPASLSPAELGLVRALFVDDSDSAIGEVRSNLEDLRNHLAGTKARRQEPGDAGEPERPFHRCGNECFSSCGSGAFAFNSGAGSDSRTTFCEAFTELSAPLPGTGATVEESQEHVVIHEGAHGTGSIRCRDFAKGTERAFGLLSREEALHNADSYTALARNLVRPGSAATQPLVADTGDLAGIAEIQEPLAWMDRWLEAADFDTSDLYNAIKQIEGSRWTTVNSGHLEASMGFVAQEFPVTPPPNAPLRRDREKMAAINDRYDRVRQVLKTNAAALTLNRGDALVWEPGPGRTVTFPEGFEALPIRERIELLVAALFRAFPDVRSGQEGNYARLAPRLCNSRTPGFAFSS